MSLASLETYLEYNDPNIGVWRDGSINNPFKPRADSILVMNNIATLYEIPSEVHKVQVSGFTEISQEALRRKKIVAVDEFVVDYATGIIQFNSIHEAKTFVFSYHGRGISLIAASRVYAMVQRNPDIVVTLQDYIDGLNTISNDLNLKLIEINQAIDKSVQVTVEANIAIDNANQATEEAQNAAEEARQAAKTTVVIRKDPVDEFDDLESVYPEPENGWQVTINTTADIYRFNSESGLWEVCQ